MPSPTPTPRSRTSGLSLVELCIVITVLAVAVGWLTRTVVSVGRLAPIQAETTRALNAARSQVEAIRATDFPLAFATFNASAADDPGGAGTAPGAGFAVEGLAPIPGDADGLVGRIEFPGDGTQLREDAVDVRLGMPRDLNADAVTDAADHALDYSYLPFRVVVEWNGVTGERSLTLHSAVASP